MHYPVNEHKSITKEEGNLLFLKRVFDNQCKLNHTTKSIKNLQMETNLSSKLQYLPLINLRNLQITGEKKKTAKEAKL